MSTEQQSPLLAAYFRFVELARALQTLPGDATMDANEAALLEAVVHEWHQGRPMTVRSAIGLAHLGSPATLHKRISRLRTKGMLLAENEPGDRRAKFLLPTDRCLQYFQALGQSIQQVNQA